MSRARPRRLLFLCNALDDATRQTRGITTDSPAASRKIFMMLDALRRPGIFAHALSLGRGRRDGSANGYSASVRRSRRFATLYLPFSNRPLSSELLSLFAPVGVLWRLRRSAARTTLLFYNRERWYLPALFAGRILGYRLVLDLEDGEVQNAGWSAALRRALFDRLCDGGALIACSELARGTELRPTLCYYGVVDANDIARDWEGPELGMLMGGTLIADTGVDLLGDAIALLRAKPAAWHNQVAIHVTGKGDGLSRLEGLAASKVAPRLVVHGRTTDAEYRQLLARVHVGLALKLNGGPLAQTTFPSKVTELAGAGLLVLTTDISDVRAVLGDGAVYLERDDPELLAERLRAIVEDRGAARARAAKGLTRIREVCAPDAAGERLAGHLFGNGQ